tara:strand:+ start:764 stop:1540 length:777 start_codon:yes stop_codon:yes gene_type:complete
MIVIQDIEQGSSDWFALKAGVISASRAAEFSTESKLAPMPDDVTYEKEGKEHVFWHNYTERRGANKVELQNEIRATLPPVYGDMRQGYMAELVGQIVTGLLPDEMSFKQCEWGNEHEDSARALFELELGVDVEVPAFIYKDDVKRCGISPDGLIIGKKIGLELKCPFTTKVFVEFATCDKIKKEYIEQCQYSMWVTGYEAWYFANYDPRIKTKNLHWVLIERDEAYMKKYDEAFKNFTKDMDSMLEKLGMEFGQQWEV